MFNFEAIQNEINRLSELAKINQEVFLFGFIGGIVLILFIIFLLSCTYSVMKDTLILVWKKIFNKN